MAAVFIESFYRVLATGQILRDSAIALMYLLAACRMDALTIRY